MPRLPRRLRPALLLALLAAGVLSAPWADAAEQATRGLRYPSLSADGRWVTFAWRGDVWVAPTDGSAPPRRLTIHEAQDTLPRLSPDGTTIAFSSLRGGSYDLFTMPVLGGAAKAVTVHSGTEILCDWSPDGKRLLFCSDRDADKWRLNLYELDLSGGTARRITRDGGREGSYSPDGKQVVYARGFNTIYQDNYTGSANYDLYVVDTAGGPPRRLTDTPGNERYPAFSADGATVYFVAEEDGVANFYAIPAAGGERRPLTQLKGADVHRPAVAFDRRTAVFEREGRLFTVDLSAAGAEPRPLDLTVQSDVRHSGVLRRTLNEGAEQVHLSRDGSQLAFSVHGDLWTMPAGGGPARRLTQGPEQDEWPRFSPDGTHIAFQSNRTGNSDIFLLTLANGTIRQLTKSAKDDFFHNWSPDGRLLVYCSEESGQRDIWTIEVETGTPRRLTDHPEADDDPSFSPDGRFIAFDSGREGTQAIYVMAADGTGVRRVTGEPGFFQVPSFSPDGRFLVYEQFDPSRGRSAGLFVIGVGGGETMQISRDGSAACWSPRGDHIYFTAGESGRGQIFRVPAPRSIENREAVPFLGEVEVDLRKELADLFDEAWLHLKNGFYDAKMHGVDWDALKKKYKDMAVDAEDKDEFHNVVRQMLAELNASHLGIHGGEARTHFVAPTAPPTGYLGCDLADPPDAGGGRRIVAILSRGPADQAGLRVGDVIVGLGKTRLKADTDLDQVLLGAAGREIPVLFKPITAEGAGEERRAQLTLAHAGQIRQLKHQEWLRTSIETVKEQTKGEVGYIHLNAMDANNLAAFQRAVAAWNQNPKIEGMVLDVRENGGGNIHQQLMDILTARPYAQVQPRGAPRKVTQPALYWDKPVVVLINERSFSDAEVFPYVFQARQVGKVVGVPTPGGVIGTNDIRLSDGSTFRIPRVGYYGMDGTNLEGLGVKPDVLVEETIEDRLAGRDPQLLKAIEVVRAEIAARAQARSKAPAPERPTPPTVPGPRPAGPTEEPPPAPTPEPEARAARTPGALDPLADVRVGEWVRYRVVIPGLETASVLRLRVAERGGGQVRVEHEVLEGPPLPMPLPQEFPDEGLLASLRVMGSVGEHALVRRRLGEEEVEAAVVQLDWGGGRLQLTFTNAIPAWGLWRVEVGNATVMEALDWGYDPPAEPVPTTAPAPTPPEGGEGGEGGKDGKDGEGGERDGGDAGQAPRVPGPSSAPQADGAAAPAADAPRDPLYDAQVGEWIRLRSLVQGQEVVTTLKVAEVTEAEVVLEATIEHEGKEVRGSSLQRPRQERLQIRGGRGGPEEYGRETLTVRGRTFECITVTRRTPRGLDKRWISPEIPVTGLVRRERDGVVVQELLDWGTD